MIKGVAAVWLPVTDMERAVSFYGKTLGLPVTEHDGDWSEVDANGLKIGLNQGESPEGDGGAWPQAANFSSFAASKSCTPPPTRLVV